jgi:hypothetical protein
MVEHIEWVFALANGELEALVQLAVIDADPEFV